MFRKSCLCCGSDELAEIIDLGMHPMADTFIPAERLDRADQVYALICDFCAKCHQIQLRTETDPMERYVGAEYSYTSSNSRISREHWTEYARSVSTQCALPANSLVVEIGSNDGFLLEQFRALGHETRGVDPSPPMAALAEVRGIETEVDLFSLACAEKLARKLARKPALIAANNVFNHANDPVDFARGIKHLLAPGGTFVFELPYWLCSIEQGKFDQIYHEHVSYFTVSYAINLFSRVGMHVLRAEQVDYHGGSLRVFVGHEPAGKADASLAQHVAREENTGLFLLETYRTFAERIRLARYGFLAKVYQLKASGEHVVCVGAAAKGNTFLNYYNLDAQVVDCVTDSSPTKIGKYTPRTRIPIRDDEVLRSYGRVHAIILSWNIAPFLEEKLRQINSNVQLMNPFEP